MWHLSCMDISVKLINHKLLIACQPNFPHTLQSHFCCWHAFEPQATQVTQEIASQRPAQVQVTNAPSILTDWDWYVYITAVLTSPTVAEWQPLYFGVWPAWLSVSSWLITFITCQSNFPHTLQSLFFGWHAFESQATQVTQEMASRQPAPVQVTNAPWNLTD